MTFDPVFRTDLYRGTAQDYDRYRLAYPEVLLADLRARVGLDGCGRLLDLACGTGQVARALAGDFEQIVAVDQEAESVAYGRTRAQASGLSHIDWLVGRAEDVVLDGAFDMVTVGNAFHRLQRQLVAERVRSWLRPGGWLVLLWGGNACLGEREWQLVLREEFAAGWTRWLATSPLPVGWQEAMDADPHERILERAGLVYEGNHEFVLPHTWSVEEVTGFCYSTSFFSRAALGERAPEFEAALAERLLAVCPDGRLEQDVGFAYGLARRPPPAAQRRRRRGVSSRAVRGPRAVKLRAKMARNLTVPRFTSLAVTVAAESSRDGQSLARNRTAAGRLPPDRRRRRRRPDRRPDPG
jgi:SAM-dependent methyltransferase